MTRVCVFVDGENLRHAIIDLFHPDLFDRKDYLPNTADWTALFDDLVGRASDGTGMRIRTYWYVIDEVDPFPYVVKKANQNNDAMDEWMSRNENLLRQSGEWDRLFSGDKYANLRKLNNTLWGRRGAIKNRFDGFHVVQNAIALTHRAVEFRRSGAISYNLLTRRHGQEKTVDVNLGIDMALLKDNYSMAIVVSGDQDYVPAVQAAKNFGKHVVNVAFQTQDGRLLPGGARRLNDITDWSVSLTYGEFKTALGF